MIIKDFSGDVTGNVTLQICQFYRKSSNFKYAKKNPFSREGYLIIYYLYQ